MTENTPQGASSAHESAVADLAMRRGLLQGRPGRVNAGLSRRDALRFGGLAAAGLGLAACGVSGAGKHVALSKVAQEAEKFWAKQKKHGHVNFANWPLYIDTNHQTLKLFTQATGITVNYQEVIQDDPSWFAKVDPEIRAGQYIGYDIMVITDGFQWSDFVALGEYTPLNQKMMTNFYKYAAPKFKNRSFDPGNTYGMPWASGSTGIAWNPKYIKDPITSINSLWDPKYAGHVGMMSDIQEIGNFGLYKIGVEPEKSGPSDWRKAAAVLKQQKSDGIVRQYYDQSYINALAKGDTWITMAWSGDIFQQNLSSGTNLQFVVPEEGGTIWTDNMTIPKYAQNPVDAMMLMDWFYRPEIAAMLTEAIEYITAVPSVQGIIAADAAKATGSDKATLQEVATSPLVWLSAADYARLHNYVDVNGAAQQTYSSIFEPVVAG
ncbi:MAG TPA: spermidine/putrescine ABC transporter substrate-binding protein [Streptosporangiaceae bacterium]|nr:spermidine/putrescine ABC transporter substrate-binding protein [Streptosporangiaceae bacterium]